MTWQIIEGDCVEQMQAMPECSVDAVVCDPPYMLGFMGKAWDTLTPGQIQHGHDRWSAEALRVLKPGGHLLAFGGTRTYHRLACAVEDAGFEIRDTIAWMYGSGFPKSLDVSKAIDGAAGATREVVGRKADPRYLSPSTPSSGSPMGNISPRANGAANYERAGFVTAPTTPDAERWQGWGTALKPAHEPIVVARKPLSGTVAANVLAHGTGALNVDGCRIGFAGADDERESKGKNRHGDFGTEHGGNAVYGDYSRDEPRSNYDPPGRWPANVVMDPESARLLDEQTGELHTHSTGNGSPADYGNGGMFGIGAGPDRRYGSDSGGASRFFYCAKTSSAERNAGLDGFEEREQPAAWGDIGPVDGNPRKPDNGHVQRVRNPHPTVKPIQLMRWLVRLVTPPGGIVLDPFAGSGTTGCAAMLEGVRFVGLEREPEYAAIARARIAWWAEHPDGMQLVERLEAERERKAIADSGQLGLFGEAA